MSSEMIPLAECIRWAWPFGKGKGVARALDCAVERGHRIANSGRLPQDIEQDGERLDRFITYMRAALQRNRERIEELERQLRELEQHKRLSAGAPLVLAAGREGSDGGAAACGAMAP